MNQIAQAYATLGFIAGLVFAALVVTFLAVVRS